MKGSFAALPLALQGALALPSLLKGDGSTPSLLSSEGTDGLIGTLVGDVEGLLGSVAASVDPDNKRPEPGFEYQDPKPTDSRGPCPALNLLANYGYLPRDGLVNFEQIVEATARGFNMATDLSTILAVFSILTNGDIETESWYLGAGPGYVGGLNRHSTVEADISPNKEDYYNGCGDNHHISSYRFAQNVKFAAQGSKQFDYATMRNQYGANARFSQQYNPYLYYFPFPSIVSVVAFNFYPEFFSNGTYGLGGVANYESISNIVGAKFQPKTGTFEYVPEKWPENWYRRATPYEAIQALTDGFTRIYPADPVAMPIAQLGTPNLSAQTILCNVYQGLNSITPLALAGSVEEVEARITWALGKLDAQFKNTILGCPKSSISPNFLYPNHTGDALDPPPRVIANAGNNTYYKTYFTTPPTKPQCNHATGSGKESGKSGSADLSSHIS